MGPEDQLTEDDIPGASLGNRQPNQLTIAELKFWLKCRGIKSSKLKTKAEYVAKVEMLRDCGLAIVDPSGSGQYSSLIRKDRASDQLSGTEPDLSHISAPTDGWGRSLDSLPEFTDMNIHVYSLETGKKVRRVDSSLPNEVSQKTCIKPEKRGYQFFTEKYLHDIWIAEKGDLVFVKGKCFASQRKNDAPHQLWCALTKSSPSCTKKAYCSCVAGASGFCNHTFALLYLIAHFHKAGLKEVPEEVSKTSVPQQWDKPRIWGINPEPLMETVLEKATEDERKKRPLQCSIYEARANCVIENDPRLLASVQDRVKTVNPLIGIAYMATPDRKNVKYVKTKLGTYSPLGSVLSYQQAITEGDFSAGCNWPTIEQMDCEKECTEFDFPALPMGSNHINIVLDPSLDQRAVSFLEKVMISKEEAGNLEEATRAQSSSALWSKERKLRLTSSNFGRIVSRKSEKTNLVKELLKDQKVNAPSLNHGRRYEDVAALKYSKYMSDSGHPVEVSPSGLIVNPSYPYLGCSPDRKVLDRKSHPHYGLLEIKCPYSCRNITPQDAASTDDKFYLGIRNGELRLKKTHNYYSQIQGQMGLTGLKWCDFVVYTLKGIYIERITFDEDCWLNLQQKLETFYFCEFLPYVLKD